MRPSRVSLFIMALAVALVTAACAGQPGPEGPEGPPGPPGPQGPSGPPGQAALSASAEYIGSETCADCHEGIVASYQNTAHAYAMVAVDGEAPDYPFSEIDGPPEGYEWSDIAYVIGGYGWKARFVDTDGNVITGEGAQYNLENEALDIDGGFAAYHAGVESEAFDCGTCHATGYSGWPVESSQDGLPNSVGTWALDGVQCEACHGPLSVHAEDPTAQQPIVARDSATCLECHTDGSNAVADSSGLFIDHTDVYPDTFTSPHAAMTCVECHNPHTSTSYAEEIARNSGPDETCVDCHWQAEQFQPSGHTFGDCVDCHMPGAQISALANADTVHGDFSTHFFQVNPFAEAQFDDDGNAYPYLTLTTACSQCHTEAAGFGPVLTFEELQQLGIGYHDRPEPTPAPDAEEDTEDGG